MNNILIHDESGSYIHTAQSLVSHFDEVGYYIPHGGAFPTSNQAQIGKGIDVVTWVDDFWQVVNNYDTIFFPDCRSSDLQTYLRDNGYNVFGSFYGSDLENNRWAMNELLPELNLPKVKMEKVIGIDNLRSFLKEHDDIYIKGSFRGDMETWHSENYKLSEPQLDELEYTLGLYKNKFEFICCYPIDGDNVVEVGADIFCIDGQFPKKWIYSYEIKDLGSVSVVKDRSLISKMITDTFDKFSDEFKKFGYRNFLSNEIRIKDKKPYVTDWTCRPPSPISEMYFNEIKNIGEIISQGAKGILVEPKYNFKYGVEAIITSEWAEKHWQPIYIDEDVKDYVRIKNLTVIDGVSYYVPNGVEMKQIGAVYCTGNTLDEAIKGLNKYAEGIKGYCLKVHTDCMEDAQSVISKGKSIGITF